MINATADESANILDDVPSRDGDESENSGNKMTKMLMKNSMTTIRMMVKGSKYQDTI